VNPLRLSVFFFSVILVLAVSQVALAQPSASLLIYSLHDKTVGRTVFLAWEEEKSDNVKSYQVEILKEDNLSGTTTLIHKSPKLIKLIRTKNGV